MVNWRLWKWQHLLKVINILKIVYVLLYQQASNPSVHCNCYFSANPPKVLTTLKLKAQQCNIVWHAGSRVSKRDAIFQPTSTSLTFDFPYGACAIPMPFSAFHMPFLVTNCMGLRSFLPTLWCFSVFVFLCSWKHFVNKFQLHQCSSILPQCWSWIFDI